MLRSGCSILFKCFLFVYILCCLDIFSAAGQHITPAKSIKYIISGVVKDKKTGETLPFASISVRENNMATISNEYGFYSITLVQGTYIIDYSFMGYETLTDTVELNKNIRKDFELPVRIAQLEEVTVKSDREVQDISSLDTRLTALDMKTVRQLPPPLGEADLLHMIQLLPGISTVGESAPGFNVRGGGIDQNLILLDEATVYNSSHLFGYLSVFNQDAIKNLKLYKSGMPVNYGGRISSVMDVRQKEGNMKTFSGAGGIGIISSRLCLEGPIIKEKTSFLVAARRSYADLFFDFIDNDMLDGVKVYFYDLNLKINHIINDKNRVYLSGYFGKDIFEYEDEVDANWGNTTATLRWNHLFSKKLFSNFTLIYSDYVYGEATHEGLWAYDATAGIKNYNLKVDFSYYISARHRMTFGTNIVNYEFEPGRAIPANDTSIFASHDIENQHALESSLYIGDDYSITRHIQLQYGLRFSSYHFIGPVTIYEYDKDYPRSVLNIVDTIDYNNGEIVKSYYYPEPRISVRYLFTDAHALKLSYYRTAQYLHLVTNTTAATPVDTWKSSNNCIKPMIGDQFAIGYFGSFMQSSLEVSIETYYKQMYDILDYKNGADLILNETLDADLLQGEGRGYGIECMINKTRGKITGAVSYALSRSEIKIDGRFAEEKINYGEYYPSNFDQPHKFTIYGVYHISSRLFVSASFKYNTGRPTSYPDAQYVYFHRVIPHYSTKNQQRIPDYHRLDISATLEGKKHEKRPWTGSWTLSFYNIYARNNAYSVYIRDVPGTNDTEAVKFYILGGIIPTLSYNFKF